jgi:hypothetical protein
LEWQNISKDNILINKYSKFIESELEAIKRILRFIDDDISFFVNNFDNFLKNTIFILPDNYKIQNVLLQIFETIEMQDDLVSFFEEKCKEKVLELTQEKQKKENESQSKKRKYSQLENNNNNLNNSNEEISKYLGKRKKLSNSSNNTSSQNSDNKVKDFKDVRKQIYAGSADNFPTSQNQGNIVSGANTIYSNICIVNNLTKSKSEELELANSMEDNNGKYFILIIFYF